MTGRKGRLEVFSKGTENVQQQCCAVFNSEYTSYYFCISDGRHKWTICKRFSEFSALDNILTQRYSQKMNAVPQLPPKTAFGSMSPSVINTRQKNLDAYLKCVLRDATLLQCPTLVDFLEIPMEAVLDNEIDSPPSELSQAVTSTSSGSVRVRAWQQESEAKWGERESMGL